MAPLSLPTKLSEGILLHPPARGFLRRQGNNQLLRHTIMSSSKLREILYLKPVSSSPSSSSAQVAAIDSLLESLDSWLLVVINMAPTSAN